MGRFKRAYLLSSCESQKVSALSLWEVIGTLQRAVNCGLEQSNLLPDILSGKAASVMSPCALAFFYSLAQIEH